MNLRLILAIFAIIIVFIATAGAAEKPVFVYASPEEGKAILTARDDFIDYMSPFDRAIRMRSEKPVSQQEFLTFIGNNVMSWDDDEKERLQAIINSMTTKLAPYRGLLPDKIFIIKTTGNEEGHSAYTRANAIVIPQRMAAMNSVEIYKLISHEIFHIMTRKDKKLAEELYSAIGFHKCPAYNLPKNLERRRLTNPDAPANDHCITIKAGKHYFDVLPLLYSNVDSYNRAHGEELFDYLQVGFVSIAKTGKSGSNPVVLKEKEMNLYKEEDLKGFFEKIGRNTDYTIHPEEILADNFSFLFFGMTDVESPEVLNKMRKIFDKHAAGIPR
ncbi:MAG: hypothetical protein ACYDHW_05510 [Syntrophorhabdaceae bacterium]